jgi:hypothetical protein
MKGIFLNILVGCRPSHLLPGQHFNTIYSLKEHGKLEQQDKNVNQGILIRCLKSMEWFTNPFPRRAFI